jgi:hypothetical protein
VTAYSQQPPDDMATPPELPPRRKPLSEMTGAELDARMDEIRNVPVPPDVIHLRTRDIEPRE